MVIRSNKKLIIPKHIAIIMDGNNRWTKKHKLSGFVGHERGIDSIQKLQFFHHRVGIVTLPWVTVILGLWS